jgi:hypothetical protein
MVTDRYWRDKSTYSIEEAALLTMGLDPIAHKLRCDSEPKYEEYFHDHPQGAERFEQICICLEDAAEQGDIQPVSIERDERGRYKHAQTRILRNTMVTWWKLHGYEEVATKFGTELNSERPENNSDNSSAGESVTNQSEAPSSLHVPGERWSDADCLALLKVYEKEKNQDMLAGRYGVTRQRISAVIKRAKLLREDGQLSTFHPMNSWRTR